MPLALPTGIACACLDVRDDVVQMPLKCAHRRDHRLVECFFDRSRPVREKFSGGRYRARFPDGYIASVVALTGLRRGELLAYKPEEAKPQDLLFQLGGGIWCPDAFSKEFTRLVRQAGVMNFRLHDMRHAFASLILQQGTSVKEVASLLGHATATLTLSTYTHVIEGMGRAAVSCLGQTLFSEGS